MRPSSSWQMNSLCQRWPHSQWYPSKPELSPPPGLWPPFSTLSSSHGLATQTSSSSSLSSASYPERPTPTCFVIHMILSSFYLKQQRSSNCQCLALSFCWPIPPSKIILYWLGHRDARVFSDYTESMGCVGSSSFGPSIRGYRLVFLYSN